MLFFGHIAISVAVAEGAGVDTVAAVAGSLLPDVTDKTGSWLLRVMPSARWLAHGLPFFALACAATRPFLPERRWRGFVLGYACHLAADLWAGGRLPLLAPFQRHRRASRSHGARWWLSYLAPEVLGLAYLLHRAKRRG